MRNPLARYADLHREPDPAEARRLARQAWRDHGIILLRVEWLQGWGDRTLLEQLTTKVHGKRPD